MRINGSCGHILEGKVIPERLFVNMLFHERKLFQRVDRTGESEMGGVAIVVKRLDSHTVARKKHDAEFRIVKSEREETVQML